MLILQAYDIAQVQRQLPGTPVVAVDAQGVPVAVGTVLSEDAGRRGSELSSFSSQMLGRSKQVGKYADFLSTGLNLAADQMPAYAHPLAETATVISLVATGAAFANEVQKGDSTKIAIAGFKFGANAVAAIDEFVPGIPGLKTTAQVCKLVSTGLSLFPEDSAPSA
jgi:hypothetical protein